MRLSIRAPSFFLLVLSSSRLPLLASPYVSLCSIFDYRTSYVEAKAKEGYDEAAYKGRDACESARYNAKEAADKGSKKASEACETTKRKAREAEAWETTKDKPREAADKGAKKAAHAWETKEVAAESW